MPGKKHLRGVGSKEQRQYEHIKKSAQKSGRYGKRATEVAARTVMKEHKRKGHGKESDRKIGGPPLFPASTLRVGFDRAAKTHL